jgi:hypothetical protein
MYTAALVVLDLLGLVLILLGTAQGRAEVTLLGVALSAVALTQLLRGRKRRR